MEGWATDQQASKFACNYKSQAVLREDPRARDEYVMGEAVVEECPWKGRPIGGSRLWTET